MNYDASFSSDKLKKFKKWLVSCGAETLIPTNEWELLRFKANKKTYVVYRTKNGGQTWANGVEKIRNYFLDNKHPSLANKNTIKCNNSVMVKSLLFRDGEDCFFCCKPLDGDNTLEHLVARVHGGPNHLSNYVLAHNKCNRDAGHLSVIEKIKIREGNLK